MSVFFLIILIPVVLLAAFVFTLPALRRRRDNLITTTGRGAIGRVVAVGRDDDDLGGSSYWVQVQYDYDGEPVTVKVGISHRDQQRYQVGQRVGLTFAPGRPQVVRLDPPDWAGPKGS
jgi:hypothetical protein